MFGGLWWRTGWFVRDDIVDVITLRNLEAGSNPMAKLRVLGLVLSWIISEHS